MYSSRARPSGPDPPRRPLRPHPRIRCGCGSYPKTRRPELRRSHPPGPRAYRSPRPQPSPRLSLRRVRSDLPPKRNTSWRAAGRNTLWPSTSKMPLRSSRSSGHRRRSIIPPPEQLTCWIRVSRPRAVRVLSACVPAKPRPSPENTPARAGRYRISDTHHSPYSRTEIV